MKKEEIRLFCNEEPATPPPSTDPETVVLADAGGRVLANAGQDPEIVIPNASSMLAATAVDHLTTFVQGLPMGEVEAVAEFLSPRIEAGLSFEYEAEADANQFARVDDDTAGFDGLPTIVRLDPRSKVTGRLQFRGLELPYGHTEQALDAATPGYSVAQGEQRRSRRLRNMIERGRLARLLALLDANVSASNIDFSSDSDPINALDDVITTLAETNGVPRSWIRILFGSTAYKYLIQHAYLTGGGSFARSYPDDASIARFLRVPQENMMVCTIQATSSKQGKTHAKAMILSATTINFFVQPPANTGSDADPGWAKTFAMRLKGGWLYAYRNVTHAPLNVFNVGLAYYEFMKCTNSSGVLQRTAVTT